eukprot:CAMPEP_0185279448 /NCGR_PEP_ID=MMETSP1359-20130426/63575_1 /TAXON_ID=552665 /ORGANISM="Bigelowiella longifila, Strain CCMP242" /LENGTH=50 /DNA_ID=CAMNT_0027874327 /DNA_START=28 /DNA_END=180 /DNA_ORIENTATION=-
MIHEDSKETNEGSRSNIGGSKESKAELSSSNGKPKNDELQGHPAIEMQSV